MPMFNEALMLDACKENLEFLTVIVFGFYCIYRFQQANVKKIIFVDHTKCLVKSVRQQGSNASLDDSCD